MRIFPSLYGACIYSPFLCAEYTSPEALNAFKSLTKSHGSFAKPFFTSITSSFHSRYSEEVLLSAA